MTDLYIGDDDIFTGGLASPGGRGGGTGVFCLHRSCLMNGCGHLDEDFCAAPMLCPVDLSKFAAVLGSSFDPIARYRTMLERLEAPASAKAPAAAAPASAR